MSEDQATPENEDDVADGLNIGHPGLGESDTPQAEPTGGDGSDTEEPQEFVMEVPGVGTYRAGSREELDAQVQKALLSSAEEGRRLAAENTELKQASASTAGEANPDPTADPDWRKGLVEQGIDPDGFAQAVQGVFNDLARPFQEAQAADGRLSQTYKDQGYNPPEVDQFIQSDPEVAERYNRILMTDPEVAREWAWNRMRATRAVKTVSQSRAQAAEDEGQMAQARATATPVHSNTPSRDVGPGTVSKDSRDAAIAEYHKTGNEDTLLDALMPIDDPEEPSWMKGKLRGF